METIANQKESLLKDLWNQQLLLIKYLDILENYAANTEISFNSKYIHNSVRLDFPKDFSSPYYQVVIKKSKSRIYIYDFFYLIFVCRNILN